MSRVIAPQFDLPMVMPVETPKTRISKQFLAAYRNGREAARVAVDQLTLTGTPDMKLRRNPYVRGKGWSKNFRHYWTEGFSDLEHGKPERYEAE
jgi:hypothetical protein